MESNRTMFLERRLTDQARNDYLQARGTAHKELLLLARAALEEELREFQQRKGQIEFQLEALDATLAHQLESTLSRQLIEEHLGEVPGIGDSLQKAILARVFRGSLDDLAHSYWVSGIGDAKQIEINKWILRYKHQLPQLLESAFDGKSELVIAGHAERARLEAQLAETQEALLNNRRLYKEVESHLSSLLVVDEGAYVAVLTGQSPGDEDINRYAAGVFGPWEHMPLWFQEAIDVLGDVRPQSDVEPTAEARRIEGEGKKAALGPFFAVMLLVLILIAVLLAVYN